MHHKEVMIDLKVARRESGLLQRDLAHLIDVTQSRISHLECGEGVLSVQELYKLSLIYNQPLEKLLRLTGEVLHSQLHARLKTMSGEPACDTAVAERRQDTLNRLSSRLQANHSNHHGR